MSAKRTVEDLRRLLAQRRDGLGATQQLPAPTMSMADIASRLTDLWTATNSTSLTNLDLADGVAWTNLQANLTTREHNLFDLAFQVAEHDQQQRAVGLWVVQAQNTIQSLQSQVRSLEAQVAADQLAASTPHVPVTTTGAIAVGTALVGGILGFMGGRQSAGGKWWPWTS